MFETIARSPVRCLPVLHRKWPNEVPAVAGTRCVEALVLVQGQEAFGHQIQPLNLVDGREPSNLGKPFSEAALGDAGYPSPNMLLAWLGFLELACFILLRCVQEGGEQRRLVAFFSGITQTVDVFRADVLVGVFTLLAKLDEPLKVRPSVAQTWCAKMRLGRCFPSIALVIPNQGAI